MSEFLVETYTTDETASAAAQHAEAVSLAADQVNETGGEVRLLHAIYLPEDEVAFYLFESTSADTVRETMTRAGLRFDRITEATSIETKPTPS
jgi:hypothetical protein